MPAPELALWSAALHLLEERGLLEHGDDGWVRLSPPDEVVVDPPYGLDSPSSELSHVEKRTVNVEKPVGEEQKDDASSGGVLIRGGSIPSYEGEQSILPMTSTPYVGDSVESPPTRADLQSNPELLRRFVGFLTGLYVSNQPVRPAHRDIQKQAAKLRQIAKAYEPEQIAQAWRGMSYTWPFSEGRPWDAFDLEKHFNKARQEAAQVDVPVATAEGWDEWLT